MTAVFVALTGVAVVGLLWTEFHEDPRRRLAKVVASTGFIAVAITAGAADSGYGRLVLVALALSWVGDLCLTYQSPQMFLAGLAAFLLAHVAYVVAFFVRGVEWVALLVALMGVTLIAAVTWRWLRPHIGVQMRRPVAAYVLAISVMVAAAFGTVAADPDPKIAIGAVAFFASDIFVARNRFVGPGLVNRAVGLPSYYAGQVLLALSGGG
jgi:uncharacterized membrane protein YhhN